MKRITGSLLAGALVAVAILLPKPPESSGPEFTGPEPPSIGASAISSLWHCAWLESGDVVDAAFLMASVPPSDVRISLPSAIPNEPLFEEELAIIGPGSRVQNVSDLVRFGASPGSVEFSDGPAAVAASVMSDRILSGDRCVRAVPKVWYMPGGTTREGRELMVRVFNPFSDLAKVVIRGVSEFGEEPLPELGDVLDVPSRSWIDIDLGEIAPLLDDLLVIVEAQEGLVVPAMSLGAGESADEAAWPGTGLSTRWDFPIVTIDDLVPELVLANPTPSPVTIEVDAYGILGADPSILFDEVAPESQLRVPLPDTGGAPYGVRVTSSGSIAAVIVSESPVDLSGEDIVLSDNAVESIPELRIAGTVGAVSPALSWLLPGAGSIQDAQESLWLMNTSDGSATVTIKPLGLRERAPEKTIVGSGMISEVEISDDPGVTSYLVESTIPITVAWTATDSAGTVFIAGVEIGD